MRQGQQNRRGRGRNNRGGGGKGHQNPLTRSFESNGPDVKLRGTPSHIAEKYMSLARDALSSGDPVLAENYLQHAEHYNRIIMAVREQQMAQGGDMNGMHRPPRHIQPGDPIDGDEFGDEDGEELGAGEPVRGSEPQPPVRGFEQQPRFNDRPEREQRFDQQPRHHDRGDRQGHDRHDRGQDRHDRGPRQGFDRQREHRGEHRGDRDHRQFQDRHDRGDRQDRPERNDRSERPERHERPERNDRPERIDRPERTMQQPPIEGAAAPTGAAEPRRRERFQPPSSEQPEFLRRPVRRPRREGAGEAPDAPPATVTASDDNQD